MQSQPGIGAADTSAPMRFASSELLKIETARPRGQTKTRRNALSSALLSAGGGERDRTDDLLLAKQALSQLSYTPDANRWWVWLDSNQRPPPYQDGALTG
jgi:hypothetical protein